MDQSTIDVENTVPLLLTELIASVEFNFKYEELQRQVEELTKQLNESKSAEKQANDEREKYEQMYNETQERFLTFEQQQLDQLRRILTQLTSNQPETVSENHDDSLQSEEFINPSISDQQKSETDPNDIPEQISELMDFIERFSTKYSEEIEENIKLQNDFEILQSEYERERQMRQQFEKQFNEANKLIEMDHTKRLQKLRNYASLADDEGDILLSSLMKKAEKNDIDFREMKFQYETLFTEQVNHIKKLVKERELLHLYIQRLESENASLASRTNNDETIKLLTYSAEKPNSYEDALNLIQQLREEMIQQIKIQDKLRNDIQQLHHNHATELREREQIEELLNRDIVTTKDQILVLESVRSEYEHILKLKNNLEREVEEYTNELINIRSVTNALIENLKQQTEQISLEKESLQEENSALYDQIQKLKIDFENSESVQHDFVKLSQALQVQLEEIRNSEHHLRWQSDEDFSECQKCHVPFSVTWRRQHCRHCGKVLCKDCVNKTVNSGPHNRPARVCDVCYTLLNKNSQPYFHAGVPKV